MVITLRFVRYRTWYSRLIEFFQKDGWATHVEAVMPDGSGYIGSVYPDGVKIRPTDYDAGTFEREQFITLTDATSEQAEAFYAFMVSQIGKGYDYLAVFGLALGRNWREGKAWFCSELIARALEVAKYWLLASICNHIDPRDDYLLVSARVDFFPK